MPSSLAEGRYPFAPRDETIDVFFGHAVPDPFRPLEEIDDAAVSDWLDAQAKEAARVLGAIADRERVCGILKSLWNYDRQGLPVVRGRRLFYLRVSGLQNQPMLYVRDGYDGVERVLFDPNALASDGTAALAAYEPTRDGSLVAYGIQEDGSDWTTWRVRRVADGTDLDDVVHWSKFSQASWLADGSGFLYAGYDAPSDGSELRAANYHHKLFFHRLGTPQSSDRLVASYPNEPDLYVFGQATQEGRYLLIAAARGTNPANGLGYVDLTDPTWTVRELFPIGKAIYDPVDVVGSTLYVRTDRDAPRGRVVAFDLERPNALREVVSQTGATLVRASCVGDALFAHYLRDAHSHVRQFDRDGRLVRDVDLPGLGTAAGFDGEREARETAFSFTDFTHATTIYRYDIQSGAIAVTHAPDVAFDGERYVTEQHFYPSKDGTQVPMFVVRPREFEPNGTAPTILYGYGGFDVPIVPQFSPFVAAWLELGGTYAVANLRGGGEYGRAWHEAGMLERKQTVFDDFIAAAEYLFERRYTSPSRIALRGGSNGGLLVGAVMTQRPDLAAAVAAHVGVFDMLRYHLFTVGHGWIPEYGKAEASEAEFRTLFAYSPLHNVRAGTAYPATIVLTGDHDDRVFPAHSFKFVAALQAAHAGDAPILLRLERDAGHGAGMPTSKLIDEAADELAFVGRALDVF